jgi:hypothetical protein
MKVGLTAPSKSWESARRLHAACARGSPVQERLLPKALRRLGIGPAHLLDHHIKILMHINPKLDRASAAIKLAAGFLV